MRLFARLSLDKAIPDHSTLLNFRHLLEKHNLCAPDLRESECLAFGSRRTAQRRKLVECHDHRGSQFYQTQERRA